MLATVVRIALALALVIAISIGLDMLSDTIADALPSVSYAVTICRAVFWVLTFAVLALSFGFPIDLEGDED